ncbi:uncharacterized protein LAESUDRAFT_727593 [Laetiporus sulphureus 93-53]|uniref:Protein kinase domain-containing protein n=1 Tax=Laetiporus sulphureus 93-53 TaxID=1314785 RepID=A0A165DJE8_9APHY|nr:uncharacterized protein LAESUDRAFT_727593 [Laetiporus sulphureus 93-53]KZT05014.1 hypothetical protein LAESUDRAFT_727593 [Laetiporus sulphureus 93-53]
MSKTDSQTQSTSTGSPCRPTTKDRARLVTRQWLRDPSGPPLPRPPPMGTRTPNGLIWGHTLTDLMWIQRVPGVNVLTVWSRSMIKEFGENYVEAEFAKPEPWPRLRRPWPVLKLPVAKKNTVFPPLGALDEGSDHEDGKDSMVFQIRRDDSAPDDDIDPADELNPESLIAVYGGALVPNPDPNAERPSDTPTISPLGVPYLLLWIEELQETFQFTWGVEGADRIRMIRSPDGRPLVVDEVGVLPILVKRLLEGEGKGTSTYLTQRNGRPMIILKTSMLDDMLESGKLNPESPSEPVAGRSSVNKGKQTEQRKDQVASEKAGKSMSAMAEQMSLNEPSASHGTSAPRPPVSKHDVKGKGKKKEVDDKKEDQTQKRQDPSKHRGICSSSAKELCFDKQYIAKIPKLEESIPDKYFPDTLMVHRMNQYVRVFPGFTRDDDPSSTSTSNTAHLWLSENAVLGKGHHSVVYTAPLTLPPPLSACGPHQQVTVAAKTANGTVSARKFLRNEARVFNMFPRHLQEEWCGYNLVTPIRHPVPVGAVVPKFYGYYVPVGEKGGKKDWDKTWEGYDEDDDRSVGHLSPVLLMEECGTPIEPEKFSIDDRSECYSLILRLHIESFVQGSMYVRNVLWQPGPLTKPPSERSRKTPSFRIIDFGRAEHLSDHIREGQTKEVMREKVKLVEEYVEAEEKRAQKELLMEDFNY